VAKADLKTVPQAPSLTPPPNPIIPMMDTALDKQKLYLGKIIHESKTRTIHTMPQPQKNTGFELRLGQHLLGFRELDWGTNFSMFLSSYSAAIKRSTIDKEINKCFLIHLAMAAHISPIRLWAQIKLHSLSRLPSQIPDLKSCMADIQATDVQLTDQILEFITLEPLSKHFIVIISTPHGQHHTQHTIKEVVVYPPSAETVQEPDAPPLILHHNVEIGHFTVLVQQDILPTSTILYLLQQAQINPYIHLYAETDLKLVEY
jgi:hypothetical protein